MPNKGFLDFVYYHLYYCVKLIKQKEFKIRSTITFMGVKF